MTCPRRIASAGLAAAFLSSAAPGFALVAREACENAGPQLPPRAAAAPSGSEFALRMATSSGIDRDRAIVREILAGNLPEHLRRARPVVVPATAAAARITLCVLPDYLAIGNDADFLLVPLGLAAAVELADAMGFSLPTRRMVDSIHEQASVRLDPHPLPASDDMRSTAYVERHNAIVRAQRELANASPDALISGEKKDLVLTNQLWLHPGRVAIYGWHRPDGGAIQPLSTVHGARYADYSHGVRLVSATAYVDGLPVALTSLLRDPVASRSLSDEGPIDPPQAWRSTVALGAAAGGPR